MRITLIKFFISFLIPLSLVAQNESWQTTNQQIKQSLKQENYRAAESLTDDLFVKINNQNQYAKTLLITAEIQQQLGYYHSADSLLTIVETLDIHQGSELYTQFLFLKLDVAIKQIELPTANETISLIGTILSSNQDWITAFYQLQLKYYVALYAIERQAYELAKGRLQVIDSTIQELTNIDDATQFLQIKNTYTLGELYLQQEEFSLAKQKFDLALELTNKILPKNHTEIAHIYNHYGRLALQQQTYQSAEKYLTEAVDIFVKKQGETSREYAIALTNLGLVQIEQGNFSVAEKSLNNAIKIFERYTKSVVWQALPNTYLGLAAQELGKNETALNYYQKAKQIYQSVQNIQELVRVNAHIANVYQDNGQSDSTEFLLKQNLKMWYDGNGKENITYASLANDLGEFYLKQQDYTSGVKYYGEAKNILAKLFGKTDYYYASVLNNLAYTHQKNNQLDLAEKYYLEMEAIDRATIGEQHPDFVYSQYGMANFYALQESPKAEDYFLGANRGQLNLIYDYYSGFDEGTRLSYLKEAQRGFDEFYSYVNDLTDKQNLITEAQNLSLAIKGLALDFSVATRLDKATDTTDLQKNWLAKRAELAAAYGLSKEEREEQNIDLGELKNASEQLEKDLIRSDENARLALQQRQRLTSADLQQKLAKNAASIDIIRAKYYEPNRRTDSIFYYAILHFGDPQRSAEFVQLAEEKQLANLLKSSDGYVKYPQIGEALADLIWQPLEPYLAAIEDVYIAPDGWLHRVAFGALPMENGLVSDQYNLLYYNHLRDFIQAEITKGSQTIALVGGSYFDLDSTQLVQLSTAPQDVQMEIDTADLTLPLAAVSRAIADDSTRSAVRFNYLAGTQNEVQNIHLLFQKKKWQTQLLTGERALEDEVKSLAKNQSPTVLHIATHGYFFDSENGTTDATLRERIINADHPLIRSGLVFTGVNHTWQGGTKIKGLDDGVLTALEISNLNLSTTDLVVLSACETGMGDVQGGEGVFGLQRAFKMAGVNQLILSLWKVPDVATAELMELFYKEYLKGQTAAMALQKAQQKMRKKYAVRDWAGFVLIN